MNSREVGNIGLVETIAWFVRNGYRVSVPLTDTQPYDLIVDDHKNLSRVSVKYTGQVDSKSGVSQVGLRTVGSNTKKTTVKHFDRESCDVLFVVCSNGEKYLIPSQDIHNSNSINLGEKYQGYICQ